ncbi:bifunctional DNA primase/polymerase, partial [Rhodopirellula sallentina SM41]
MGFVVVPLCVGKKRLSLRKGELAKLEARSLDREWVKSQWPPKSMRNVGIRLGAVSGGVIAMDFDDARDYHEWANSHADLAARLPTVQTRRGFHVFL